MTDACPLLWRISANVASAQALLKKAGQIRREGEQATARYYDLHSYVSKTQCLRGGTRRSTTPCGIPGFTHQNYSVADSVGERPLRGAKRLTSNI